jgi:hypothetical protein
MKNEATVRDTVYQRFIFRKYTYPLSREKSRISADEIKVGKYEHGKRKKGEI